MDRLEELRIERGQRNERLRHLHASTADLLRGITAGPLVVPESLRLLQ